MLKIQFAVLLQLFLLSSCLCSQQALAPEKSNDFQGINAEWAAWQQAVAAEGIQDTDTIAIGPFGTPSFTIKTSQDHIPTYKV
eukprot:jgi/Botrbrau1/3385/Bobra.0337s0026.1